jgi:hypothetical protein
VVDYFNPAERNGDNMACFKHSVWRLKSLYILLNALNSKNIRLHTEIAHATANHPIDWDHLRERSRYSPSSVGGLQRGGPKLSAASAGRVAVGCSRLLRGWCL